MIKLVRKTVLTALILLLPFRVYAETDSSNVLIIYRQVLEEKVEVVVETLNVRTGPGLDFPSVGIVNRGNVMDVLATCGDWYVVYLQDGSVGMISGDCVKIHSIRKYGQGDYADYTDYNRVDPESIVNDSLLIKNRINSARLENNLDPYILDERLDAIAQIKADDMVENNYFGHYSELYGTPLAMMKQFGAAYRSMTENIIGNISAEGAFANIMADPVHRGSTLSARYDRMGIGVADSETYGKVFVMLFVQD